ncbi:MAG: hypothetical protein R2727_07815 [Bacteroidales bacterium]
MHNKNRAGLKYSVTPLNYEGEISIRSELRGDHKNSGVERYNSLEQQHLQPVSSVAEGNMSMLVVKTVTSGIEIATGAIHTIDRGDDEYSIKSRSGDGWTSTEFRLKSKKGIPVTLEKVVSIFTGLEKGVTSPSGRVMEDLSGAGSYSGEVLMSGAEWELQLWDGSAIAIDGDREAMRIVRLHTYHTLATRYASHC